MLNNSPTTSRSSSPEHLAQLASLIHSSSETESRTALESLAHAKSNDSGRALIDAYRDCHWRDTRIAIIRALGRNGSQRAIDFLFNAANDTDDIGLCQESILALGDSRDPLAATHLLRRLNSAPLFLKPWIVSALARTPDLRAAPLLRELLISKECDEHPQLMRNCVVALAEMKDTSVLPQFLSWLRTRLQSLGHQPDTTTLTLLSAVGRLSRNPEELSEFAASFESEMLHQRFFEQSQTQISFREQWTLEDYLGKIFFSDKIHRALPLELNSFPQTDLEEAITMFASEEKHFDRLCLTLSALLQPEKIYQRCIKTENLGPSQLVSLLANTAMQRGEFASKLCEKIYAQHIEKNWSSAEIADVVAAWLRALICIESDPIALVMQIFASIPYSEVNERNRIELINAFVSAALALRKENSWPKKLLQTLSEMIHKETNPQVLGRWLRALGELALSDLKWNDELIQRVIQSPNLHSSALLMLEREEQHQNSALLRSLQPHVAARPETVALFMRACARLKNHEKDLPSDDLLHSNLDSERFENRLAALNYLSQHPRQSCMDAVIKLCAPDRGASRITVSAIVAARSYKHEKFVAVLQECLASGSKVISGRALDTLLAIDHPSARQSVVTFFVRHLADSHITDKVLRSLRAPSQGESELAKQLEDAINHTGNAALKDDISELAARLRLGSSETLPALPGADAIRDIDKQLESKITDYAKLADPIKASLRSAELPLNQPELFEGTVDKSASVVQYCKAIDLALEKEFGARILFPKMEQQLHVFQNILHQAELDQESPNINLLMRHLRSEHVFDLNTFPASKMMMVSRSILSGRILRERTQVIDGLKAWAVMLLLFSGHERLWGAALAKKDPLAFPTLAHKLVVLQDLRNPAAHRQTMLALAPLSEIRKEVFSVFALMKKAFETT
ncbi:HEAT repeat domain-containing protein [bacterium]|nr:HEAT repeat domain-containing protein [bacterium]